MKDKMPRLFDMTDTFKHNHDQNNKVLKRFSEVSKNGVKGKVRGHSKASGLAGWYYSAMETQNELAAYKKTQEALERLSSKAFFYLTPQLKGVLVVALFQVNGPARSFKRCTILGAFASRHEGLKYFDNRDVISNHHTQHVPWWGYSTKGSTEERAKERRRQLLTNTPKI